MTIILQPAGTIVGGGCLLTLGGQPLSQIGRLSTAESALQDLVVPPDGAALIWQHKGSGPQR